MTPQEPDPRVREAGSGAGPADQEVGEVGKVGEAREADAPGFAQLAAEHAEVGPVREFLSFLRRTGKWWLLLILLPLLFVGAVLVIGGTAAGPFLYTLF